MKLLLTKNQSKGLLGGVKFEMKVEVQLTDEENDLIKHYKLTDEVLFNRKAINFFGFPTDKEVTVTVGDLLLGETYKCKDMSEVITNTNNAIEACQNLKAYLKQAREFDGETIVIEIPDPEGADD